MGFAVLCQLASQPSALPLIDQLSFIKSKTHWGAAFRSGQLKVPARDFALIAEAMGARALAAAALHEEGG